MNTGTVDSRRYTLAPRSLIHALGFVPLVFLHLFGTNAALPSYLRSFWGLTYMTSQWRYRRQAVVRCHSGYCHQSMAATGG